MAGSSLCDDGSDLICHMHEPKLKNLQTNIRNTSEFEITLTVLFDRILKICFNEETRSGYGFIDPYQLFSVVKQGGGFDFITKNRSWDSISEGLGFGFQFGSSVKSVYMKYLDVIDQWSREFYDGGGWSYGFSSLNSLGDDQSFFSEDLKQKVEEFIFDLLREKKNSSALVNFDLDPLRCDVRFLDVSIDREEHNVLNESSVSEIDVFCAKRKHDESLMEMLAWLKIISVGPCDVTEWQILEWWYESLSAREVLFGRGHENSNAEATPLLKKQKTLPSLYEDSTPSRNFNNHQRSHFGPSAPFSLVASSEPSKCKIQRPQRSPGLLKFSGDRFLRKRVPIGSHFQANLPKWTGPHNNKQGFIDFDNSKLGTQIWPVEGHKEEFLEDTIGKGRPDLCSCSFPGSVECVRVHVTKERDGLKSELGPAFFSWRFDNMGEEVSKTWTFEERRSFKALVRLNPLSSDKSFWKPALKCFSYKNPDEIVSFYFNVFVLRRMRIQSRLSSAVDSEDDEGSADEMKTMCPVSIRGKNQAKRGGRRKLSLERLF